MKRLGVTCKSALTSKSNFVEFSYQLLQVSSANTANLKVGSSRSHMIMKNSKRFEGCKSKLLLSCQGLSHNVSSNRNLRRGRTRMARSVCAILQRSPKPNYVIPRKTVACWWRMLLQLWTCRLLDNSKEVTQVCYPWPVRNDERRI